MTPHKYGYAAIALALMILTGCGQGVNPVPPIVGGPVGPGVGGCFPLTGAGTVPAPGGFGGGFGNLNIPISFQGAQFTPNNRRITAGRIPMGTVPTSGFPGAGTSAGQVIMGGVGAVPMPTTTMPGSYYPTTQWTGMNYQYGGIQISFQPTTLPVQPTTGGTGYYGGYNPYMDSYGLPTQPGPVNGNGMVQLNAIAIQTITQMVTQMQYGNVGPYTQPGLWPNQPGYNPMVPTQPIQPQQICISEVAFSADIAVGRTPSLWLGDVWIYVNNSGHGLRMMLQ